ncbi:MAG: glutamine amidotransferase [Myxococcales bacterium]|jgi:uncharacterized membrane protein
MGELSSWSLRLGNPGGTTVGIALAVALLVVAAAGVPQTLRVQGTGRRIALLGLRLLGVLMAAMLALQPEWITERVENVQGRLAVLLDVSRSMSIRDGLQTRAGRARGLLSTLAADADVPFDSYGFGSELRPINLAELGEAGLAKDDDTRVQRALEGLAEDYGDDLGAVLLVSDGADMAPGWSPAQLEGLGVRVHTLAMASDRTLVDDGIVRVRADPVSFLRQAAQVEVTVRSTRASDQALMVTLRRDDQVVAEAAAELDEHGEGTVTLPFTPERLGRSVYTLSVPLSAEDSVPENNERAFLVRVTRDKLRVLLVCGAPSWDTRFLRAFLKSDPAIDLITFFILRTATDLTMAPPEELSLIPFPTDELFREHLDSFDLVIFQDFNYGPYQMARYLPRVRDYVRGGGAFAMIGGNRAFGAGGYIRTAIADILPVRMLPGENAVTTGEFRPVLEEETARHPIVELVPDPAQNLAAWRTLAPLLGANRLAGVRGDGLTLLSHPTERDGDGGPMPVLVVGSAGEGRVMALGVDASWRWGMATAGRTGDPSAYERFWDRSLRWLARDPSLDPARVQTDRERYGPGARVRAQARLRDARYQALSSESLEVLIMDGSGGVVSQQRVVSDAAGEASVELLAPEAPGGYRVTVRDPDTGQELADEGFVVEAGGDELADPQPRPEVLAEVAAVTGGEHFREGDPPDLDALDRTRARALGTAVHAPFASPWFFLWVALVFAAEWAARRAWGLR